MDARLTRIRELIDQKETIDTELASLIGGMADAPKRGRPKKTDGAQGGRSSQGEDAASDSAQSE